MVMEGDLTLGGKHTLQYRDDIQNCILEYNFIKPFYSNNFNKLKNKDEIVKKAL